MQIKGNGLRGKFHCYKRIMIPVLHIILFITLKSSLVHSSK